MKRIEPARGERFLSRWSRLKRADQGAAPAAEAPPGTPQAKAPEPNPQGATPAAPTQPAADANAVPLPAIESLTIDSDYSAFFQPKVPDALRRAAVKKLFADPHFNVMDGLDTYIDDYSKPDPISEEMLRSLNHAQGFFQPVQDPLEAHGFKATTPTALSMAETADVVTEQTVVAAVPAQVPDEVEARVADQIPPAVGSGLSDSGFQARAETVGQGDCPNADPEPDPEPDPHTSRERP